MSDPSLTTRRGFLAGAAGSVLGLAGVWGGLGLITGDDSHSHGSGGSISPKRFRAYMDLYLDQYRFPDGTVRPPTEAAAHDHAGEGSSDHTHKVPVYLKAMKWEFVPGRYVLTTGVPYDFRMMAMDVTHGASIETGRGSLIHRLPPGQFVRDTIEFEEPGEYPVYCSFYCGRGHPEMSATLVVEG